MGRRVFLLIAAVLLLSACSSEPEKQWYKPGVNYTIAEFQRDQAACTKNKALDEACMKERGWVSLSGDRTAPVKDVRPADRPVPGGKY